MAKIYYLHRSNDIPFYIGKTIHPYDRLHVHKITYGEDTKLEIIEEVDDLGWVFWEKFYISLFRSFGFILLNKNDGGGGCPRGSLQKSQKLIMAKSIPIIQYNLEGVFVREHYSANQVAISMGLTNGTLITQCLKGRIPTAYGSVWKYKTENYPRKINPPIYFENNLVPIIQYNLEGKLVKKWGSILEASKSLNYHSQSICNNLKNRSKSAYKSIWKYQ